MYHLIRDRILNWRDRFLLDPRFVNWSFAVPGVRTLARREARALFHICAGFVYSQILLACVRLKLFEQLAAGPRPLAELAADARLPEASMLRLLNAARSLRLFDERSQGRWGLGALGAAVAANPSISAMVEHHATLYADLFDPLALLGTQKPATQMSAYWPYASADKPTALADADVATYTALMAASQAMISNEVIDAYDFSRHRNILDVGGGDGSFLVALARRVPQIELNLFDLPAVAERANARFAREGLAGRARAAGGDMYASPLPQGADIVTLIRVLFDHDDDGAVKILRTVRSALPISGTLLIAEPMSRSHAADPIADAYYSFYLLAMGRGRSRSPAQFARLLDMADFTQPKIISVKNPMLAGVIAAHPKNSENKV